MIAIMIRSNASVEIMSMAWVAFFLMSGFRMNVYRDTAAAPESRNATGIARYGVVSHTWIAESDTYTPMVANDACAKLGTRVVRYVSVSPRLSSARRLANMTASENIGSICNYATGPAPRTEPAGRQAPVAQPPPLPPPAWAAALGRHGSPSPPCNHSPTASAAALAASTGGRSKSVSPCRHLRAIKRPWSPRRRPASTSRARPTRRPRRPKWYSPPAQGRRPR